MRFLKFTLAVSCCLVILPIYAQKNIITPVVKSTFTSPEQVFTQRVELPFEQALRLGGRAYMIPNSRIGGEALTKGASSRVGLIKPTFKTNLKRKAYQFCAQHFNPAKLDALVERNVVQEPFPAYYISFSRAWEQFSEQVGGKLGTLEVILEAAYGEDALFTGAFLQTYSEVVAFSKHLETEGTSASEALLWAYSQGMEKDAGFFAVRVKAGKDYPQDVLLLDIQDVKNIHWISMRQSIGGEWMDTHWMEEK